MVNDSFIPLSALIPRAVYRLKSRNLLVGVWDPAKGGFIGVRQKFTSRYLFTEYHWDVSETHGTAQALELLDTVIPTDLPLVEYLPTVCSEHASPMEFTTPILHGGDGWVHQEDGMKCGGYPVAPLHHELFDILAPIDEALQAATSNY